MELDLAGIAGTSYSTAAHNGRICRKGVGVKFLRRIGVCLAVLFAAMGIYAQAAPPRIIDEVDGVRAANFDDVEIQEMPRTISPRSTPTDAARKTNSPARKPAGPASLWGTVIGLGVVFAMFLGARVWLTRHGPVGIRGLPVEALELLGKRTIEPRVSIHIVRCGPKVLVLGVSPDGVRTLTEITDPVEIDLIAGACRRKDATTKMPPSFAGMIQQSAGARGAA
jgi:flagellar biogenesis protein FliO